MIYEKSLRAEFTANAAIVALVIITFALTIFLIRLLNEVGVGKLDVHGLGPLLTFSVFKFIPILLPLASFLGVFLTLTRWYRDSEMVVWLSSGVPLTASIRPIVYFVLPLMLIAAGVTNSLLPWAYAASNVIKEKITAESETAIGRQGVFREFANGKRIIYAEDADQETREAKNVFISERGVGSVSVIVAKSARHVTQQNGDKFVILNNGHRYEFNNSGEFKETAYEKYGVRVSTREASMDKGRLDTLSIPQLLAVGSPQSYGDVVTRIGLVLMVVILPLLSVPLSYVNPRAGRSVGTLMALLIFFAYYNFMTLARSLVMQEKLNLMLGLVGPHLIMCLVGLVLIYHQRINRSIKSQLGI